MENQLFVKIEENKEILDIIDLIKKKLAETKDTLDQIESIRQEEESELKSWRENVSEVENKILDVDKNIFNSGM